MRVVSLFTGAGGLDLGLKKAGHEILMMCEQDPGAQQVLRQNFPGTLLISDVCSLKSLPKVDPLQATDRDNHCRDVNYWWPDFLASISVVLVSEEDLKDNSGLVRHVFRLLKDAKEKCRPVPWVLLENVEALLDRGAHGIPYVKHIADSFEVIGYSSWAHRVVCSAGFGVPNRRSRVFFLASMYGDARDVLLAQGPQHCLGSCMNDEVLQNGMCYECYMSHVSPQTDQEYSFALDLGNARSAPGVDVVPTFTTNNDRICLLLSTHKMGMLRIEDAERLQGFPEGFTWACYPIQQPGLNSHKSKPLKDAEVDVWESKRYALLGNAVTVKVAEWLGERLASPYQFKYIPSERDRTLQSDFMNDHSPEEGCKTNPDVCGSSDSGLLVSGCYKRVEADPESPGMPPITIETCRAEVSPVENSEMPLMEYASSKKTAANQKRSWPRACWFVSGIGRFGVDDISECPKKVPFQPLGKFITQVGKIPGKDVINTYIMRLREQGWNVENIVKKATSCGLQLIREVSEVVRLQGGPEDPDQIGPLVWCIDRITKVWWPGYMLDPFNLPPKASIPAAAVQSLSKIEKKAWLPIEYWEEEDPNEAKTEVQQKKEEALMNDQRKVVVIFFGDNCHDWVYVTDTLDFEKHQADKEKEARALDEAGNLKRPKLFFRALEDAILWLEAKKSNMKNGRSSAIASRAASMAATENKKPRCGKCEACLNKLNGGNAFSKRCLYVRAQAAAAAGHVGAQVAIHRHRAAGAKIEVYWPLDQKWFPGIVTGFDKLRLRHTVLYEDGDREIIPLWSPCQLIRVMNEPKDWPAAAEELERREEEDRYREQLRKESFRQEVSPLTEFEISRKQTIQKNKEILSSIMDEEDDSPAAFDSLTGICSSAENVQAMLNGGEVQEKPSHTVDVLPLLEFGGPCRHTRSAGRELKHFLDDTPLPKRPKLDTDRESI